MALKCLRCGEKMVFRGTKKVGWMKKGKQITGEGLKENLKGKVYECLNEKCKGSYFIVPSLKRIYFLNYFWDVGSRKWNEIRRR